MWLERAVWERAVWERAAWQAAWWRTERRRTASQRTARDPSGWTRAAVARAGGGPTGEAGLRWMVRAGWQSAEPRRAAAVKRKRAAAPLCGRTVWSAREWVWT